MLAKDFHCRDRDEYCVNANLLFKWRKQNGRGMLDKGHRE